MGAAIAIVVAAILVLLGAPVWILLALVALPWLVVFRTRGLGGLAISGTLLLGLLLVFVTLCVSAPLAAPFLLAVVLAVTAAGVLACWLWLRSPDVRINPTGRELAEFLPALTGAVIWLGATVVTAVFRGTSGIAWAMHGDAASYLLYARSATAQSGILLGPHENPVPLPAALLALFMAPGRATVSPAQLLSHDLRAAESLQIAMIAISCVLAGLLAGALTRATTSALPLVIVSSVCGSVLPLSWIITTVVLKYGYFDAQVALPIVLASVLLALGARAHPVVAAGLLAVSCTIVLAVWSPLVVVPFGLLVAIVILEHRSLLRSRGRALVFVIAAGAQLLAFSLGVALPSLLAQGHLLSAPGATFALTHALFPSLAAIALLLTLLLRIHLRSPVVWIGASIPISLGVGLGVLLYASGTRSNAWTYYPTKFELLATGLLAVLILGLLPAVPLQWFHRRAFRLIAASSVVLATTVVCLLGPPSQTDDPVNPLLWIAQPNGGQEGGTAIAGLILRTGNLQRPTLFWDTGMRNERYLNYWEIELASRSMNNNALRKFAFRYDETHTDDLCTIIRLIPRPVTIHTANPDLAGALQAECRSADANVTLDAGS